MQGRIAERDAIDGGDIGEIEIRGLSMMTGYYGDTALGDECWLLTGALGYLTDDGTGSAFSRRRNSDRAMVARHETGPRRRRHRRGAVGPGDGRLKPHHAGYEVLFGRSNA